MQVIFLPVPVGCLCCRPVKEVLGSGRVCNIQTAQCNFGENNLPDCYLHWRLCGTACWLGPPKLNEARKWWYLGILTHPAQKLQWIFYFFCPIWIGHQWAEGNKIQFSFKVYIPECLLLVISVLNRCVRMMGLSCGRAWLEDACICEGKIVGYSVCT